MVGRGGGGQAQLGVFWTVFLGVIFSLSMEGTLSHKTRNKKSEE